MSSPIEFDITGNDAIDNLLGAVESAAREYHDVNQWYEDT